jgi:phospholipid transport system substrate-binding protein
MIDRRNITLGLLGLAGWAATPALALTDGQAAGLVNSVVDEINSVIASGKSESAMIRDFERIFARYSDTAYVSAYAMGADARRATAAQKRAFSDAFQGYIARKYGRRFREFIGGRLEVQGARRVKNWIEVETIAFLQGQSPFEVTFHVSDRGGRPLFFNMYIEGINMLLTERTEVGALLDRNGGDIDRMIAALRQAG